MHKTKLLLRSLLKPVLLFVSFITVAGIYYFFDPSRDTFFISCPLKALTGYECAGCGSQRAFHALLHFHFLEAVKFNVLFVMLFFIVICLLLLRISGNDTLIKKFNGILFGKKTLFVILIIILLFSLFKNTVFYKGIIENL